MPDNGNTFFADLNKFGLSNSRITLLKKKHPFMWAKMNAKRFQKMFILDLKLRKLLDLNVALCQYKQIKLKEPSKCDITHLSGKYDPCLTLHFLAFDL